MLGFGADGIVTGSYADQVELWALNKGYSTVFNVLQWLGSNKILMGLAVTGGLESTGGVVSLATVS